MSRLLAKSIDVYKACNEINAINIPRHKQNRTKIKWEDIETGVYFIECYLSKEAVDLLTSHKIEILKDPFSMHARSSEVLDDETTKVSFPSYFSAKEEYKRDFVFLLGTILSLHNLDKDKGEFSYEITDEYREVLPLLLEYLYMKDSCQEDAFALKRIEELKTRTKDYTKKADKYKAQIEECENIVKNPFLTAGIFEETLDYKQKCIDGLKDLTHQTIIPMSSMDATLQLIDKNLSVDELCRVIAKLFRNEYQDRSRIMEQYGVESNGYKRLIKEYEQHKR